MGRNKTQTVTLSSPPQALGRSKRKPNGKTTNYDNQQKKQKVSKEDGEITVTKIVGKTLNSDEFPLELRPEMFRRDSLFNKLDFDCADAVC